jgi:uncharacterized protein (DUF427 family)
MGERGRVKLERGPKRVRGYLNGVLVVDSLSPLLVWEKPYYPAWYLPEEDVVGDVLRPSPRVDRSPSRGDAHWFDLQVPGRTVAEAAWHHPDSPIEELRGHVRFEWAAMDAWYEEDEEVYVHPRDPYKRVDVLRSSRHVRVLVDGAVLADTVQPTLLFETSLPTRYYLPKTDVRLDLLRPTATTTQCPYKGTAEYYTATVDGEEHVDLAWWYRHPVPEVAKIAGLVAFWNERVDLEVDGEVLEQARTPFSR